MARELVLAEHHPRQLVRTLLVGLRERHRHVQVRHPRLERRREDRLVEARVARVQHRVRLDPLDQRHQLLAAGGVHLLGREAVGLPQPRDHVVRALRRDVGQHHLLERRPPLGDRGKGRAHSAGSHNQDSHLRTSSTSGAVFMSVAQIRLPERTTSRGPHRRSVAYGSRILCADPGRADNAT